MTEQELLGNEVEEDYYDPEGEADEDVELPKFSTQVLHPWKATIRTAVAVLIAAVGVLQVLPTILTELGSAPLPEEVQSWLLGASATLAGLAGAATRIMAIPRVSIWIEWLGLGTGVTDDD